MKRFLAIMTMLFAASTAQAQDAGVEAFRAWLDAFGQEALEQGVSSATLRKALPSIELDERVIELDRKQPESRLSFDAYIRGVLSSKRIVEGRAFLKEYGADLKKISARYGVAPSVIVALWAVESSYGRSMGDYDVLGSLATLAFEGRRASFFRKELLEALKILDEESMDPAAMKGSWAGAMGQSQFMPSTYRRYAVDWDGDGRRDIWSSDTDALASIARYLSAEGWKSGLSWGREVRVTRRLGDGNDGLDTVRSLDEWARLGVRSATGAPLPQKKALKASLIRPDGEGGRTFLVYDNFRAIMRWNKSTYFATSVGLLSDQLGAGR